MTMDQNVLEPVDCLRFYHRRGLPDLEFLIALSGSDHGLLADAREVAGDCLDDVGSGSCGRPFLCAINCVSPALDDYRVVLQIFVRRHERRVVSKSDRLADGSQKEGFAVKFEL